ELAEKEKKEKVVDKPAVNQENAQQPVTAINDTVAKDTVQMAKLKGALGAFAFSATLPSASAQLTTLENKLVVLTIANKGGYIVNARLKNYKSINKKSGNLVELIKNNNASLNIALQTQDNRTLDTKNLFFEPTLTKSGEDQVLTMRLKAGPNEFLEYRYVLKPNDYMLDFDIRTQGLNKVLNTAKPLSLEWGLKAYRNEKSASYENRYVDLRYSYDNGKDDYLGQGNDEKETINKVAFIAFKQHFFSSILLTDKPFENAEVYSDNLVKDDKTDTIFTKQFKAIVPLAFQNGEINEKMNWYYGPTDYKVLKSYERKLEDIVPLGWGIFGWINKYLFIPLFSFLTLFLSMPQGWAIIVFTILVKLILSPITYKSFLSQAKMKVLRPDIAELAEKFKKDPMKKQQETMKLYNKAGVNPMAGCIPALLQMPVFYALFQFFPAALSLRHEGFLWASDLSSFDSVLSLPFYIPFYGNHVSLFPILASIAIFFYMKMTTGDQQMAAPQQEGMPDMAKIMKIMIYLSPLMMMFFFNNNASGLSLYYFISNTLTIGIMLVIKNYIVDNDKIHAQIQENKLKEPKKQSKFQLKMQEMMEQAEAQKAKKGK
ncbi:MAG TPA: membrane protein insertase YidC, partial [Flavobacterium sp.]